MNWREAIREGFPSPRDQEPAELRQDIADELADHLACALRHELRRTDDESEARRRVLERFGDPKRLAYRLWFDAMRETIMKDRVLLVGMVVMIITCLATCAVAWRSMQDSRTINQAVLARLEALTSTSAPQAASASEWGTVRIRVVNGSPKGPPLSGVSGRFSGWPYGGNRIEGLRFTTDANGAAGIGPIRPGRYTLRIATDWGYVHM